MPSPFPCTALQHICNFICRRATEERPAAPQGPASFYCPVSMELMSDPVMVATGHTYDRQCIAKWLAQGNRTCPVTGMRLRHLELVPNHALRNAIQVGWLSSAGSCSPAAATASGVHATLFASIAEGCRKRLTQTCTCCCCCCSACRNGPQHMASACLTITILQTSQHSSWMTTIPRTSCRYAPSSCSNVCFWRGFLCVRIGFASLNKCCSTACSSME